MSMDAHAPLSAAVPADLDTPDQVLAGLTARQVLITAAFALPILGAWRMGAGVVPVPVLAGLSAVLSALGLALALGRRDGLGMDAWLGHAIAHQVRPRTLLPATPTADQATAGAGWAPLAGRERVRPRAGVAPAVAGGISPSGVIDSPAGPVVLVCVSTITAGLYSNAEQAGLAGGFARWLNGLNAPVQIRVSLSPVDLGARALRVAEMAPLLSHRALSQAAISHAQFLADLGAEPGRYARSVTITCTGPDPMAVAVRTSEELGAIGATAMVASGQVAAGVISTALNPNSPDTGERALASEPVTGWWQA